MTLRTAIAMIAPREPEVLREVEELERLGQPVVLIPPHREERFEDLLRATVLHLLRNPKGVLKLLAPRTLMLLPRSVYLANQLTQRGVNEVRARSTGSQRLATTIRSLLNVSDDGENEQIANIEWSSTNVRPHALRSVSRRSDSMIAEVAVIDGGVHRDVIFKQHRELGELAPGTGGRARREYDILQRLRRDMTGVVDGVTYSVPGVVLVDEKHSALVIERACGQPLDALIRAAKAKKDAMTELDLPIRRAATWLRLMQDATRTGADARDAVQEQVQRALEDIDISAGIDRKLRGTRVALRARLQQLEASVLTRKCPVVGHHGDYWPGNIFLSQDRVEVIDYEGFREGLRLEDVAYFSVQLDLLFPRRRENLPRLQQLFLDAYFDGREPDTDALALFTLTKTLRLIARTGAQNHPAPLQWWIGRTLRNTVLRCLP